MKHDLRTYTQEMINAAIAADVDYDNSWLLFEHQMPYVQRVIYSNWAETLSNVIKKNPYVDGTAIVWALIYKDYKLIYNAAKHCNVLLKMLLRGQEFDLNELCSETSVFGQAGLSLNNIFGNDGTIIDPVKGKWTVIDPYDTTKTYSFVASSDSEQSMLRLFKRDADEVDRQNDNFVELDIVTFIWSIFGGGMWYNIRSADYREWYMCLGKNGTVSKLSGGTYAYTNVHVICPSWNITKLPANTYRTFDKHVAYYTYVKKGLLTNAYEMCFDLEQFDPSTDYYKIDATEYTPLTTDELSNIDELVKSGVQIYRWLRRNGAVPRSAYYAPVSVTSSTLNNATTYYRASTYSLDQMPLTYIYDPNYQWEQILQDSSGIKANLQLDKLWRGWWGTGKTGWSVDINDLPYQQTLDDHDYTNHYIDEVKKFIDLINEIDPIDLLTLIKSNERKSDTWYYYLYIIGNLWTIRHALFSILHRQLEIIRKKGLR